MHIYCTVQILAASIGSAQGQTGTLNTESRRTAELSVCLDVCVRWVQIRSARVNPHGLPTTFSRRRSHLLSPSSTRRPGHLCLHPPFKFQTKHSSAGPFKVSMNNGVWQRNPRVKLGVCCKLPVYFSAAQTFSSTLIKSSFDSSSNKSKKIKFSKL